MTDDYCYLERDAQAVGALRPDRVQRVHTADGSISALQFGTHTPRYTLLHGAGLEAHTFDRTLLALGEDALSFDLPGHGDSAWRADADYQPSTLAPAVATAVAELTASPQILVGHSLGGLIGAVVAVTRPELIRQLILIDITPGVISQPGADTVREFIAGQADFANVSEVVDRAIAFGIGSDREALTRGVFFNTRPLPNGRIEFKHHLAKLAALGQVPAAASAATPEPQATQAAMAASVEAQQAGIERLWSLLEQVPAPIGLIRAESGFVDDRAAAEWTRRLPNAPIISVPAGHNVQEHNPVGLAAAIRDLSAAAR